MAYYTDAGPEAGPILWHDDHTVIGVLESPDDPGPIGMAAAVARAEDGVALWKLAVRGAVVPGRWIVVGREFWPEELADRLLATLCAPR
jgi:hypothetical protein